MSALRCPECRSGVIRRCEHPRAILYGCNTCGASGTFEYFEVVSPGTRLRRDILPHLGVTPAQAADWLQVPLIEFNWVLDGKAPINRELAARLARHFGSSIDCWVAEQVIFNNIARPVYPHHLSPLRNARNEVATLVMYRHTPARVDPLREQIYSRVEQARERRLAAV